MSEELSIPDFLTFHPDNFCGATLASYDKIIEGDDTNNYFKEGSKNDLIVGYGGIDYLPGGTGDCLIGGDGADVFKSRNFADNIIVADSEDIVLMTN